MVGTTIGHYRVTRLLGEGGMGAVYQATDVLLEREVALKMLRPALAGQPELVERFRREAITLARLAHPHVTTLYGLVQDNGQTCMVMEYVAGESLETFLVRAGRLSWSRVADMAAQVLAGLDSAHRAGIVHRDLKPANVVITTAGDVKIMDFGIARVLGSARQTREGRIVGTPEYMAPEQVRGLEGDARTDVYALGVMLYELLTGHVPFGGDDEFGLMQAIVDVAPVPLRSLFADVPEDAERLVLRALAKDPAERFEDAAAFRTALAAALPSSSGDSRRTRLAAFTATRDGGVTKLPPTRAADDPAVTREASRSGVATLTGAMRARPAVATAVAVVVLVLAGFGAWRQLQSDEPPAPAPAMALSEPAAAPEPPVPAVEPPVTDRPAAMRQTAPPPVVIRPLPQRGSAAESRRVADVPRDTTPARAPEAVAPEPPAAPVPVPPRDTAVETPRPVAPVHPDVTFTKIKLLVLNGDKSKEVDATLTLRGDHLHIVPKGQFTTDIGYGRVTAMTYSRSKQPRWKEGAVALAAGGIFAAPVFFMKSTKHWLSIEQGSTLHILRLDKDNVERVIQALELRRGRPVERVIEEP